MSKTIVIVDDSAYQRKFIADIVEAAGFEVVGYAKNGEDAVDTILDTNPSYVTIDRIMPGMTGVEAVEAIRAEGNKSKIMMVSSVAQDAAITEALAAGVDFYLKKPFNNDQLIEELNKL